MSKWMDRNSKERKKKRRKTEGRIVSQRHQQHSGGQLRKTCRRT